MIITISFADIRINRDSRLSFNTFNQIIVGWVNIRDIWIISGFKILQTHPKNMIEIVIRYRLFYAFIWTVWNLQKLLRKGICRFKFWKFRNFRDSNIKERFENLKKFIKIYILMFDKLESIWRSEEVILSLLQMSYGSASYATSRLIG